ncbi:MAG: hypothetical protein H7Z10_08650 [Gemmatimonadaceae bacterium]|nr:hypothetical protein [Acetobacteraceae bacterium]
MAALAPDLRGLVVLGLAGLGLCGGATLARSLPTFTWDAVAIPLAIAVVVQAMALAVAWVMASGAGRHASTTRLRGLLTLAAASRNASFAWAAAMGLLTPRAEAVLAFSLAGTFFLPALFLLWHGHRTRRAAAGKACQKA